ncbi:PP2C family protein-serine/threonine phosphatase [Kitasatospora sp. NPDC101801]|uniref:PP2C family protein-serine/threonine phosphatase n=1 Tax=Kitasatospora sp. NPDC101801 TaxID=3364103 RepID=UPI0037F5D4B1
MPAVTRRARQLTGRLRRGPAGRWAGQLLDGDPTAEKAALGLLLLLVGLLSLLAIAAPTGCPPSALALPLILGGFLLHTRRQCGLLLGVAVGLAACWWLREPLGVTPGSAWVVGAAALVVLLTSRHRSRLGLRGTRGDAMLLELSERTTALGRLPDHLLDWRFHQALAPVSGTFFSGDFVLSAHRPDRDLLEVLLVDVSGKGSRAAARSMHLSGAFAMLLGSVPPESCLPTANDFLARLGWDEGFATAVHLALHPSHGGYRIFTAGHPPAAQYRRESGGSWLLLDGGGGPALGILPGARYPPTEGRLDPGDSLLLYSDGLVEVPGEDIDDGIARLLRAATPLLRYGGGDPAAELIGTVARNVADDRTLVVLRRLGAGG